MIEHPWRHAIETLLTRTRTLSLATAGADGQPHAANLWFVHDEQWCLYFVSNPGSAHARNVVRDARIAVTIYAHTDNAEEIHGLQLHGRCAPVACGAEQQEAWRLLGAKFPELAQSPVIQERLRVELFYRVTPTWARWIDNRKGFGFKMDWDL